MSLEKAEVCQVASPVHLEQEQPVAATGGTRRDLAIALSLANLCYLRVWSELLTYRRGDTYLMKSPPGPAALGAVTTNVLLVAALLWGGVTLARKVLSGPTFGWVQAAFLLFLAVPLNALREVAAHNFPYLKSPLFELLGTRGVAALAVLLALSGAATILLFRRKAASLAANAMLLFLPFCAVTFGQGFWKIATYRSAAFAPNPPAPPLPHADASPRVVWILFDEWDYRLTFVNPEEGLHFPGLEKLAGEALVASGFEVHVRRGGKGHGGGLLVERLSQRRQRLEGEALVRDRGDPRVVRRDRRLGHMH